MGHILSLFTYLLTYYFRFRSGTRVPVVLPDGYPSNKLPGYGSLSGEAEGALRHGVRHLVFGISGMAGPKHTVHIY